MSVGIEIHGRTVLIWTAVAYGTASPIEVPNEGTALVKRDTNDYAMVCAGKQQLTNYCQSQYRYYCTSKGKLAYDTTRDGKENTMCTQFCKLKAIDEGLLACQFPPTTKGRD